MGFKKYLISNKHIYKFRRVSFLMNEKTILLLIIFIISIVLALAFAYLNYKHKRGSIDYYVMFIVGIAWTVLGIVFKIILLTITGGIFTIIGYIKKNQWENDWSKLSDAEKEELHLLKEQTSALEKFLEVVIFSGTIFLLGIIAYVYFSKIHPII